MNLCEITCIHGELSLFSLIVLSKNFSVLRNKTTVFQTKIIKDLHLDFHYIHRDILSIQDIENQQRILPVYIYIHFHTDFTSLIFKNCATFNKILYFSLKITISDFWWRCTMMKCSLYLLIIFFVRKDKLFLGLNFIC